VCVIYIYIYGNLCFASFALVFTLYSRDQRYCFPHNPGSASDKFYWAHYSDSF